MGEQRMCELFLEADNFFNGKHVMLNKINKSPAYKQYCPNRRECSSNRAGIGALSTHLFIDLYNLGGINFEYFMMWLAHKLFKIVKDKENANEMTLSSAYDEYLKNNMGNFIFWNLLYNQRDLHDANLRYMNELYTLLNYICNTIAYYKTNKEKPGNLRQNSVNCLNQYRSLYNTFYGNDLYLNLLEKLKKIYEDFRDYAIKSNTDKKYNIKSHLLELTPINKKYSHSTNNFKTFDSNGPERIPKNKDNVQSVQDKAVKDTTTTQKSKTKGMDQSSQKSTTKNIDDNLKVSEPVSQQEKGIQFPKTEDSSLKDVSKALKLVSNVSDSQKTPNGQDSPTNESETNKDRIDISPNPKGIHDVFDLSTLKEYRDLVKQYIKKYKEHVTSSYIGIQNHLYENIWPTLYETYNTYADYYKNFDIMKYLKEGIQAIEPQKTEILKDIPPSKENELEIISPLPDSKTPYVEKSEPKDTQTQISDGQGNEHSQVLLSTQETDSTNSEQEQISDNSSKEQPQSSGGFTNIMPRLEIEARTIKADVQNNISEIGYLGNVFKEYKLVVYSVIVIATFAILTVMYKYLSFGWSKQLKKKKNMEKIKKLCNENDIGRKLQIY
ncbi:BIR protein [Plasmodium berghei]|uniref:BIR protein n=2 Tax=Plasmodium berghei TaxID=5821 RepID=A0A077XE86_PLABA|nr:BIR protein [Plasmodium berghei ANKA]CXI06476.1 BIR protein [Plasmodium berghei]CXI47116.1 BIR protein [Plasmodium berghei]SBW38188.1 BIR protein [Plasmodium berghei]SCL83441.1 BIR protein [Plasmodium berghei]SCL84002.1 BIR protein [Plasmodium berghei]|eukprot:XP_034421790.1 BIR protein [Plasmodium berghei ANKA]